MFSAKIVFLFRSAVQRIRLLWYSQGHHNTHALRKIQNLATPSVTSNRCLNILPEIEVKAVHNLKNTGILHTCVNTSLSRLCSIMLWK